MARPPRDDDDIDDDAPWLAEGVRDRGRDRGGGGSTMVSRGRLIGGTLIALALVVLVGIGIYVISARKQDGSSGFARAEDAPLITADAGPYKVAPVDPGGAAVTGVTDSIAAAGSGDDSGSAIDTTAVDEEPLARPSAATAPPPVNLLPPDAAPVPASATPVIARPAPPVVAIPVVKTVPPKVEAKPAKADALKPDSRALKVDPPKLDAKPKADAPKSEVKPKLVTAAVDPLAPVKAKPEPAKAKADTDASKADTVKADTPNGGEATLQLGAFSTEAKADAAWAKAVAHAGGLAALAKRVDPVERGGATLYRLRTGVGSKAAAVELCAKLKAAGDACLVI